MERTRILAIIFFGIFAAAVVTANGGREREPRGGYTLFAPMNYKTAYLIDIRGKTVHTWSSDYMPIVVELLEDTNLLRTAVLTTDELGTDNRFLAIGGRSGRVEIVDWDGNLHWEYEHANDSYMLHHDVEVLPNGNILMIAWEYKTPSEAKAAGRNPSLLSKDGLWPDKIIEVDPGGNIVWEWHAWNHLIQDYDATRANYGVVAAHPERMDLNYIDAHGSAGETSGDWLHTDAVDYNPQLDQILLTVHNFCEVWIIDHSTTTIEAKGSTGGNSGKGGDLLYRWGNPEAYGRGTSDDQKLFVPHDGRWIEPGLPGEGDIMIFNNGTERSDGDYSSVDQITPPVKPDGGYYLASGSVYKPENASWTYTSDPVTDFYAPHVSGAHRLENGNTLICNGPAGILFEVTDKGNVVWEYDNPYGKIHSVFRATRYSPNYPGLGEMDRHSDD